LFIRWLKEIAILGLKEDILRASRKRDIDPYNDSFKPSELGLKASKYGSFSDYCSKNETLSGQYNNNVILKVVERDKANRPRRYLLLK